MDFNVAMINIGTPLLIGAIAGIYLMIFRVKDHVNKAIIISEEKVRDEIGKAREVVRQESDSVVKDILHSIEQTTQELKASIDKLDTTLDRQTTVLEQISKDQAIAMERSSNEHSAIVAALQDLSRKIDR